METRLYAKPLWTLALFMLIGLSLRCSNPDQNPNSLKRAWDSQNKPDLLGSYETKLSKLPSEGKVKASIWGDNYWPSSKGGIAYRWHAASPSPAYPLLNKEQITSAYIQGLSPAEKYDLLRGEYDFPFTRHEIVRTGVLSVLPGTPEFIPGLEIPAWEGLCHGWAPASYLYKEPKPVIVKNKFGLNIPFGSSDIKALLARMIHDDSYEGGASSSSTILIGARCNLALSDLQEDLSEGKITKASYEQLVEQGACEDMNAGTFHIILTNEIGIKNATFLIDVTRGEEVWNHPIHSYRSVKLSQKDGASTGSAAGTVKEIEFQTTIHYVNEISASWQDATGFADRNYLRKAAYKYRIELNANEQIIGGEWLSDERPDFAWRQTQPKFQGVYNDLQWLYEQSLGIVQPSSTTGAVYPKCLQGGFQNREFRLAFQASNSPGWGYMKRTAGTGFSCQVEFQGNQDFPICSLACPTQRQKDSKWGFCIYADGFSCKL